MLLDVTGPSMLNNNWTRSAKSRETLARIDGSLDVHLGVVNVTPGPRMLFLMLLPLLVALVLLLRRPGGVRGMLSLRLRALPLLWAAAAVKFLQLSEAGWAGPFLEWHNGLLPVLIIWVFGVAFTLLNLRAVPRTAKFALGVFAVGFTLNTLTTVLNGGMPFSVKAAHAAGLPEKTIAASGALHEPVSDGTVLAVFADIIPVPLLQKVVSIGDVLMFAGLAALVVVLARQGAAAPCPTTGGGTGRLAPADAPVTADSPPT